VRVAVATFTVRGAVRQTARWKQAAEAEGYSSVGAWLAGAADSYLKARAQAGMPLPLAWHRGQFTVQLEDGPARLPGFVSLPFGAFRGSSTGRGVRAGHRYTLVYIPKGRIVATFQTYGQCKALASDLARLWVRGDGSEPVEDPTRAIQAHP
jgi:hypothetical protein